MNHSHAIVLLSHGSRSPDSTTEFLTLVDMVQKENSNLSVFPAQMSLAEPSLNHAVEKAAQAGAKRITVVPCFLFHGNHIKEDIPSMIETLKKEFPDIVFSMGRHIGADPQLANIVQARIREAL